MHGRASFTTEKNQCVQIPAQKIEKLKTEKERIINHF